MYPWVLEARAQAAPGASVALVIARHPLSWVTGMRKAPYFLTCGSRAPDSPCWLRLVWRHGPGEQAEREHLDVKYGGVVDVWNAYYGGYLAWSRTRYALIRYEDLLLDSDRTLRALFPGAHHAQQRRAAKRHGHARSFADARAYNLGKMARRNLQTRSLATARVRMRRCSPTSVARVWGGGCGLPYCRVPATARLSSLQFIASLPVTFMKSGIVP